MGGEHSEGRNQAKSYRHRTRVREGQKETGLKEKEGREAGKEERREGWRDRFKVGVPVHMNPETGSSEEKKAARGGGGGGGNNAEGEKGAQRERASGLFNHHQGAPLVPGQFC